MGDNLGAEVNAYCECGYQSTSLIGGGMANFHTTCYFPALCTVCNKLVQVNLLAKRVRCHKCRSSKVTPYDNPELSLQKGDSIIADWHVESELGRVLILHNGTYLCPLCKEFKLRFIDSGLCWD